MVHQIRILDTLNDILSNLDMPICRIFDNFNENYENYVTMDKTVSKTKLPALWLEVGL